MAIPIDCECGKTVRVKDEFAGRRVRCPACKAVLAVPLPEAREVDEDEAVTAEAPKLPAPRSTRRDDDDDDEQETEKARSRRRRDDDDDDDEQESEKARSRRRRYDDDDDDDDDDRDSEKAPKKKRHDPMKAAKLSRGRKSRASGGGSSVNLGLMGTGILMMVGAVVWFVVAFALGWIFYYPPVLFIFGIVAVVRGLMGHEE